MSNSKYNKGGKNPHMNTSEKRPCDECGERVMHYTDGSIEKHKIHYYKKIKGVFVKTSHTTYCTKKRWF